MQSQHTYFCRVERTEGSRSHAAIRTLLSLQVLSNTAYAQRLNDVYNTIQYNTLEKFASRCPSDRRHSRNFLPAVEDVFVWSRRQHLVTVVFRRCVQMTTLVLLLLLLQDIAWALL